MMAVAVALLGQVTEFYFRRIINVHEGESTRAPGIHRLIQSLKLSRGSPGGQGDFNPGTTAS